MADIARPYLKSPPARCHGVVAAAAGNDDGGRVDSIPSSRCCSRGCCCSTAAVVMVVASLTHRPRRHDGATRRSCRSVVPVSSPRRIGWDRLLPTLSSSLVCNVSDVVVVVVVYHLSNAYGQAITDWLQTKMLCCALAAFDRWRRKVMVVVVVEQTDDYCNPNERPSDTGKAGMMEQEE